MFKEADRLAALMNEHGLGVQFKADQFDREFMERSTRRIAIELLSMLEHLPGEAELSRLREIGEAEVKAKRVKIEQAELDKLERLVAVYERLLEEEDEKDGLVEFDWHAGVHELHRLNGLLEQIKALDYPAMELSGTLVEEFGQILAFLEEPAQSPLPSLHCPISPRELEWHAWSLEHRNLHTQLLNGACRFFGTGHLWQIWETAEAEIDAKRAQNHLSIIQTMQAMMQTNLEYLTEIELSIDSIAKDIQDILNAFASLSMPIPQFQPLPASSILEPRPLIEPAAPLVKPDCKELEEIISFLPFAEPPSLARLRDQCQELAGLISSLNKP